MYYSEDLKLGFLTPPRTGSRTVRTVLRGHGFTSPKNAGHHMICLDTVGRMDRVYVTVRNHWDCLASWWSSDKRRGGRWAKDCHTFEGWLKGFYKHKVLAGHKDSMAAYIEPGRLFGKWLDHATHTLRFETLNDDLHEALPFDFELPHVTDARSTRNGRHYSEFYTDGLADWVGEVFRNEIDLFGYRFERE